MTSPSNAKRRFGSGFHHLESQSQFLFGAAFMDVNEENQKICAENLVIQSLLDQSSSSICPQSYTSNAKRFAGTISECNSGSTNTVHCRAAG